MESELIKQSVMAFVLNVEDRGQRRDSEGYVMFVTDELTDEIVSMGRAISDFLDIEDELEATVKYPAFMVWEGSVRYTDDDYYTNGEWRRARASEIISAAQGRDPFAMAAMEPAASEED